MPLANIAIEIRLSKGAKDHMYLESLIVEKFHFSKSFTRRSHQNVQPAAIKLPSTLSPRDLRRIVADMVD